MQVDPYSLPPDDDDDLDIADVFAPKQPRSSAKGSKGERSIAACHHPFGLLAHVSAAARRLYCRCVQVFRLAHGLHGNTTTLWPAICLLTAAGASKAAAKAAAAADADAGGPPKSKAALEVGVKGLMLAWTNKARARRGKAPLQSMVRPAGPCMPAAGAGAGASTLRRAHAGPAGLLVAYPNVTVRAVPPGRHACKPSHCSAAHCKPLC